MADNNNDKPGAEDASILDTDEYLKTIFREELNGIPAEAKKKTTSKYGDETSGPKEPKPPSQVKGVTRKKPEVQMAIEKRKPVKPHPPSRTHVDRPGKGASEREPLLKKPIVEKTAPPVKDETPEEIILEDVVKIGQTKGGNIRFGRRPGQSSDRLKIVLLCAILVAALVSVIHSLGIVDFGRLLGFSEPTKEARSKIPDAKKPPAGKSTPAAVQTTQKKRGPTASDKGSSPEIAPPVGPPSEATLSEETRRVIERPTASTKQAVVAEQFPKSADAGLERDVPEQPAKHTAPAQDLPVTAPPAQAEGTTQEPLVAQKPPISTPPEVQPAIVEGPPKSAGQTLEQTAPGKEEPLPVERDRDLPHPYSVYLGSFKTLERTERAISEHRIKGLSPYWVKIDLGDKGEWYRVFSGYFEKREQADEFIEKNQILGAESRHTRYANLIGIFESQEELDEQKLRLSKLGFSPYVVPAPRGKSRLYVGAFYQKGRAQRQHAELASKGIPSQIAER